MFSLPNGFRVTVELELNILQFFSGIEQQGNIMPDEQARFCDRKAVSLNGTKICKQIEILI